mgnify:CR=1 FL=1
MIPTGTPTAIITPRFTPSIFATSTEPADGGMKANPVASPASSGIELKASYINPYTQKRALELIDSGRLDVSSMVYAVESLDNLADILAKPELRANGKYIISPEK